MNISELELWDKTPIYPSNNRDNERTLYKINPFTAYTTKEGIYQANMANRNKKYTRLSSFKGVPQNIIEGTPFGVVPQAEWRVREQKNNTYHSTGLLQRHAGEIPNDIVMNSEELHRYDYNMRLKNYALDTTPYKYAPQRLE